MVELRLAQPDDAEAIRTVVRRAYAKWIPVIGREPWPMTADYDAAVRAHRFDLLMVGQVLAGLVETIDEGDRLLVENLAVAPDFQRRGFGRRLMARAEAVALSLGYDRVRLFTNQQFSENIALYQGLGYRIDAQRDIGAGTVRVDMSKRLGRPI